MRFIIKFKLAWSVAVITMVANMLTLMTVVSRLASKLLFYASRHNGTAIVTSIITSLTTF